MKLKGWPVLAMALLSGSHAANSSATAPGPWVQFRDPEIFQAEAFPALLSELSIDPDVRIAVANTGLRILASQRVGHEYAVSSSKSQPYGLAALIAREGLDAGMDPTYLVRLANRESHFDPFAESPTSSATGLFQFTDNTWLCSLQDFGPVLGIAGSDQIRRNGRGVCETSGSTERSRLLALRSDAILSTRVAAAFSLRNYRVLSSELGRRPTATELYILHFFGENTGLRFLEAYASSPSNSAYSLARDAAASNARIFFAPGGRPRSVDEVFGRLSLARTERFR